MGTIKDNSFPNLRVYLKPFRLQSLANIGARMMRTEFRRAFILQQKQGTLRKIPCLITQALMLAPRRCLGS